jgi:dTDP-6-deoxy-L-talose 4-dehydrogenase (NAD+)
MKVAVTGATGFIGKYVLCALSHRDVQVTAMVRNLETANLGDFHGQVVQGDLYNPPENLFEQLGFPDVLIHLAWSGLPNYKSTHHFERELPSQYNFLGNLVKAGLSHLCVTGTCFEYGMYSGSLQESIIPNPTNPYGYAKNALRCQLEYLQASFPFQLTWMRLFYLYGDGQSQKSLFSQFSKAVADGVESFNMSPGDQLRDYLPVSIAAKYIVNLSLMCQNIGIINVCSGKPVSVRSLVEKWSQELTAEISLNLGYYSYPDYEPMAFLGNQERLDSIGVR